MKTEEIRIGNWVNDKLYGDFQIIGLVVFLDGNKSAFKSLEYYPQSQDIDKLNPIPLTEDWLLKFGFSDKGYINGFIGKDFESGDVTLDFVLTKPLVKGKWNTTYTFELPEHRFCKLEFVHELQNLYYTLTGEELVMHEA